jgi:hypothetical protein
LILPEADVNHANGKLSNMNIKLTTMHRSIVHYVFSIVFHCAVVTVPFIITHSAAAQETPVMEWARGMTGSIRGQTEDVAVDASGNVYSTGYFEGTVDFDPGAGVFNLTSAGGREIFILKLNAAGNFIWAKQMGGASDDTGYQIALDPSGNIYTSGYFAGTADFDPGAAVFNLVSAPTFIDIFISKLDNNGNFVWAKRNGNNGAEEAYALQVDASGNAYVAGHFSGTVDFDPNAGVSNLTSAGNRDIFVSKLDTNGNFIWAKRMGGPENDEARKIALDGTGNIYITGYFRSTADFDPGAATFPLTSAGAEDIYIAKLNSNGDFLWAGQIGDTAFDTGQSLVVDASGNVYVTGYFRGTPDFDPGAGTFDLASAGDTDIFILKLNANGEFTWCKKMGSPLRDDGNAITLDNSGNVYTTGFFNNTVDFEPNAGTYNLTSAGQLDIFISKLTPAGDFVWAARMGGADWDQAYSITVDANLNVYTGGYYRVTADFDPGPCVYNLTALVNWDPFVQKIRQQPVVGDPSITSFTPSFGPAGTSVIITGTNFSTTPANNIVQFNGITATVTASTATSITTTVPGGATSGKVSVAVNCITTQSVPNFIVGAGPGPTITSFTPSSGPIATTVTITGTNFSTTPANNTVQFNGVTATPTTSTSTSITTTVPSGATTGKITVTVAGNMATSATDFTVLTPSFPTITNFTPASGPVSTTVTITGTNFSAAAASNTVQFNGTTAVVTSSTTTSIITTVPTGATTGKITVTVAGNTATSAADFTVTTPSLPTITSFNPPSGAVGTTVVITGTNFSATAANNTVRFNGTLATATASTTTSITTTVPAAATTGKITVVVAGNTATSATDFTVTTAAGIVINPQPQSISTCEGSVETFSIDASGAANITYQWQMFNGTVFANISNGGGYSGVTTKNLTVDTDGNFGGGEYRCRVSGTATPDVFSQPATLTINAYPVAEIQINGSTLVATAGDSYQWHQNGSQVPQGIGQTLILNVAEFGSYMVDVTVDGCTSTSDEFIYLMTGTETIHDGLKIYPNPFKNQIGIELPSEKHSNLKIIDALGRTVRTYSLEGNATLNLSELSIGSYFVIIQTGVKNSYYRLQKIE